MQIEDSIEKALKPKKFSLFKDIVNLHTLNILIGQTPINSKLPIWTLSWLRNCTIIILLPGMKEIEAKEMNC